MAITFDVKNEQPIFDLHIILPRSSFECLIIYSQN